VEPGRLRFDFSHFQALAAPEVEEVERLANRRLIENGRVETTVTGRREAEEMGALAFFGEKYGERVRVVRIGTFSTELCGGTHTHTAAQVGPLVVTTESSIGSNLRRVEALTGDAAYERLTSWRRRLEEAAHLLRVPAAEVPERLAATLKRMEALEDEVGAARSGHLSAIAQELATSAAQVKEAKLVVDQVPGLGPDEMRRVALEVRERLGSAVVVLGGVSQGKGSLVAAVSPSLVAAGVSAAAIAGAGAAVLGGGGSRDPELAQAGGPHGDRLEAALESAGSEAERSLASL
jgi:alanyl-tRNA synthetase